LGKNLSVYDLTNFTLKWFGVVLKEVMMIFACGTHDWRDSGHTSGVARGGWGPRAPGGTFRGGGTFLIKIIFERNANVQAFRCYF